MFRIRSWASMKAASAWLFGGLPAWLIYPGMVKYWSQTVHIGRFDACASELPNNEVIDLYLGKELLLEKRMNVPLSARANVSKAVDLKMRQSLPGGGGELIWRFGTGKLGEGSIDVPIYLLKRSVLSEIRKSAVAKGSTLRLVMVADDASAQPFWDERKHTDRAKRIWFLCTLAFGICFLGMTLWQGQSAKRVVSTQVSQLEAAKAVLAAEALKLREERDLENAKLSDVQSDLEMFQADYQRLPVLLDLTLALGDESWVSELSIDGTFVRFSGFTEQEVTDVITTVRGLDWVNRVDLDGPVSFDSFSRKHRFDLAIQLKSSGKTSR